MDVGAKNWLTSTCEAISSIGLNVFSGLIVSFALQISGRVKFSRCNRYNHTIPLTSCDISEKHFNDPQGCEKRWLKVVISTEKHLLLGEFPWHLGDGFNLGIEILAWVPYQYVDFHHGHGIMNLWELSPHGNILSTAHDQLSLVQEKIVLDMEMFETPDKNVHVMFPLNQTLTSGNGVPHPFASTTHFELHISPNPASIEQHFQTLSVVHDDALPIYRWKAISLPNVHLPASIITLTLSNGVFSIQNLQFRFLIPIQTQTTPTYTATTRALNALYLKKIKT